MLDDAYQQWLYHHLGTFDGQGVVDILILLRHCKLSILEILEILVHLHQKSLYQFEGDFQAYLHTEKSTSLYFFLDIYQRSSKRAILGNMVMPGYTNSHSINSKEPFMFVYRLKIGFILHVFLQILQGYYKLVIFRTLTMVCYITQSDITNL